MPRPIAFASYDCRVLLGALRCPSNSLVSLVGGLLTCDILGMAVVASRSGNGTKASWATAGFTVGVGFFPFLILSIRTDTFWPHSAVSVPLTFSPSILIGDSIAIPIFNAYAIPLIIKALRSPVEIAFAKRHWTMAVLSATLSWLTNIEMHIGWTKDKYTGFIDPTLGKLSLGGWWHCAFASCEMAFVLFLVSTCLMSAHDSLKGERETVLRAWRVFLLYSTLPVVDTLVIVFVVGRPLSEMTTPDYFAVSPLLLASLVYLVLSRVFPG